MNFYPIYRNKKLLPWIKWWLIKGNKVMPKHLSEWINSASAITITGVYKGSPLLNLNLNGNTSQDGTPSPEAPVPVNVVKGNNTITINDTDYQINLNDYELCKIGDYKDVIYKQNNKYYVEKKVGKVVLNGSESSWVENFSAKGLFQLTLTNVLNDNATMNAISDLLQQTTGSNITGSDYKDNSISTFSNNRLFFRLNSYANNLDGLKTFLGTNNLTAYYVLAESTITEITETNLINQLEAIYNAKLQSGTNEITQLPSDLPFYLSFQYYEKG